MKKDGCNKEIEYEAYVYNGWHKTCHARCGWWKSDTEKHLCDECKKANS